MLIKIHDYREKSPVYIRPREIAGLYFDTLQTATGISFVLWMHFMSSTQHPLPAGRYIELFNTSEERLVRAYVISKMIAQDRNGTEPPARVSATI